MERIEDKFNNIVVLQSSAAVGLIVQDRIRDHHTGAFLSPEDARKVADALNRYADAAQKDRDTDVKVVNHGSIVLLTPCSKEAREWISKNVDAELNMFGALTVEPRYADTLIEGMQDVGLLVA